MKPLYNTIYAYQKTITITVQEIYGKTLPEIPEGWEPTGEFRPPKENEVGLSSVECFAFTYETDESDRHPRIILRKIKNYSDTEILDFVMKWLYKDVGYNGVTSANGAYDKAPGPIYRQLVSSPFAANNPKELREVIATEMKKKGK